MSNVLSSYPTPVETIKSSYKRTKALNEILIYIARSDKYTYTDDEYLNDITKAYLMNINVTSFITKCEIIHFDKVTSDDARSSELVDLVRDFCVEKELDGLVTHMYDISVLDYECYDIGYDPIKKKFLKDLDLYILYHLFEIREDDLSDNINE